MPETPAAVTAEFHEFLKDAAAIYGVTTASLGSMRRELTQFSALAGTGLDDEIHLTTGDMPTDRPSDAFAVWTRRRIDTEMQAGGSVPRLLGHQWVSHVFAMWEHGYRPRLAAARGVALGDVLDPLLGDLRLLRNDVLHCKGVATAQNTGHGTVLQWFAPGEDIVITGRMVYEFVDAFGLAHPAPAVGGQQ